MSAAFSSKSFQHHRLDEQLLYLDNIPIYSISMTSIFFERSQKYATKIIPRTKKLRIITVLFLETVLKSLKILTPAFCKILFTSVLLNRLRIAFISRLVTVTSSSSSSPPNLSKRYSSACERF